MNIKNINRKIIITLISAMVLSCANPQTYSMKMSAASKKPSLSKTIGNFNIGQKRTVKIKGVGTKLIKRIKITSLDKKIVKAKKTSKKSFTVTAKSYGSVTVRVKLKLKKAINKKKAYTLTYVANVMDPTVYTEAPDYPAYSAIPTVPAIQTPTASATLPPDTVTVTSLAELEAALKDANAKKNGTVSLVTKETDKYEISAGTYSNVSLIVDAPNATITNGGTFKSIVIKSIASNTWYEKGNKNSIIVDNTSAVHIVLQSGGTLSAVTFKGTSTAQNLIEILSGTLSSLNIAGKEPVKVVVKGSATLSHLIVDSQDTNVSVNASESGRITTIDAKQGALGIEALGSSTVSRVNVAGTSRVTLTGNTKNAPLVDITAAKSGAKLIIDPDVNAVTVNINKNDAATQKNIIEDRSGIANVVEVVPGQTSTASPNPSATPIKYSVSAAKPAHGTLSVSPSVAAAGSKVTIRVTPDSGYKLRDLYYTYNNKSVNLTELSFTMPSANVTVHASFTEGSSSSSTPTTTPVSAIAKAADVIDRLDRSRSFTGIFVEGNTEALRITALQNKLKDVLTAYGVSGVSVGNNIRLISSLNVADVILSDTSTGESKKVTITATFIDTTAKVKISGSVLAGNTGLTDLSGIVIHLYNNSSTLTTEIGNAVTDANGSYTIAGATVNRTYIAKIETDTTERKYFETLKTISVDYGNVTDADITLSGRPVNLDIRALTYAEIEKITDPNHGGAEHVSETNIARKDSYNQSRIDAITKDSAMSYTISIKGGVETLQTFASSDSSQGSAAWIGLKVTVLDSDVPLTSVGWNVPADSSAWGPYLFSQAEIDEANSLGITGDKTFILWIKADNVAANGYSRKIGCTVNGYVTGNLTLTIRTAA
ncbi:MAG: hypothetical protein J6P16_04710 [Eubacterium sp.]|nr:hypothetical protein [Eubacterium sp.]